MSFRTFNPTQMDGHMTLLNTGRRVLDALVAVFALIVLGVGLDYFRARPGILEPLRRLITPNMHWRTIVYRCYVHQNGTTTNMDTHSRNEYLVRAITIFVHQLCKVQNEDANVDLTDIAKRKRDGQSITSTSSLLKACKIAKKPVQRKWLTLGIRLLGV